MPEILIEGALFVVLIVTAVALIVFTVLEFTPLGLRLRQARNRRLIEQAADRVARFTARTTPPTWCCSPTANGSAPSVSRRLSMASVIT